MRLFGIRIRFHPTFLWLVLFILLWSHDRSSMLLITLAFVFVVLHELSHSLMARAFGISVRDITLLPIGGIAHMESMPEEAKVEFLIAIAGPAFNFAVLGLASALLLPPIGWYLLPWMKIVLWMVFDVNLVLGLFNLLPAFPMDGGRLLRAYLTAKQGHLEATYIAARVGRLIAAGMAAVSVMTLFAGHWNPWLLFIAAFIYVAGKQEEIAVTVHHATKGFQWFFGFGGMGEPEGGPANGRGEVIDTKGTVRKQPDKLPGNEEQGKREISD